MIRHNLSKTYPEYSKKKYFDILKLVKTGETKPVRHPVWLGYYYNDVWIAE